MEQSSSRFERINKPFTWIALAFMALSTFRVCLAQAPPQKIDVRLHFVKGSPPKYAFPFKLPNMETSDPRYREFAKTHHVLASGILPLSNHTYPFLVCKGLSSPYLLVDTYGKGSLKALTRYESLHLPDRSFEFREVMIGNIIHAIPSYRVYLRIMYHAGDSVLDAFPDWYRIGRFPFLGVEDSLILYQDGFPGFEFFLGYDDMIVIEPMYESGDLQSSVRFNLGRYVYKLTRIDSLGRSLTLTFVGTDSARVYAREQCPPLMIKELNGSIDSAVGRDSKVTLIDFWATWCGACVSEMPQLYREYSRRGFEIVGVASYDKRGEVEAFVRNHHIPWPIGLFDDTNNKHLGHVFHPNYYPKHILINRSGTIAAMGQAFTVSALKKLLPRLLKGASR